MAKTPATVLPSLKPITFVEGDAKDYLKEVTATQSAVYNVPIEAISVAPGYNVRITSSPSYLAEMEDLVDSILQEGFYRTKPLAGYVGKDGEGKNTVFVIDGHRRLAAVKIANSKGAAIERLPVILKPGKTDSKDLTVSLLRENSGQKLSMMEQAILVKRMFNEGTKEPDICTKLNLTKRYLNDLLVLIGASKPIRNAVMAEKISGTEAVKILRRDAEGAEAKILAAVAKAEEKGKARATAADTDEVEGEAEGGEAGSRGPAVKMQIIRTSYALNKGQDAPLREVTPFLHLFTDADWYEKLNDTTIRATEDVKISIEVRRPRKEEAAAEADAAPEKPVKAAKAPAKPAKAAKAPAKPAKPAKDAAKKPAGKAKKADAQQSFPGVVIHDPALDDAPSGEDPDLEEAPNLRELGIADPASDL